MEGWLAEEDTKRGIGGTARKKKRGGGQGEGSFWERGGPEHPAEEETFRLDHYVFTLHVLHTISHSLGFSIFFSWDVLVWRSFVFLWSKIWRACCILCSSLVNVLWYLLSTLLDLWINRPNGFDTFLKGFIFISHCYSLVPQLSSRRELKVTRWVEFRLKVSLAACDKVEVGFSVLPWFILEERYLCKRWRTPLPHRPKLGFHGRGTFFVEGRERRKERHVFFPCMGGNSPTWVNAAVLMARIRNIQTNQGPVSRNIRGVTWVWAPPSSLTSALLSSPATPPSSSSCSPSLPPSSSAASLSEAWRASRPSMHACRPSPRLLAECAASVRRLLTSQPPSPAPARRARASATMTAAPSGCRQTASAAFLSPSRRRRPCPSLLRRCWWRLRLKELPRWKGMPWAEKELVLVTGLVLPMMALGLGLNLEPRPKPMLKMEPWVLPIDVIGLGLKLEPRPIYIDEGLMPIPLTHFKLAHQTAQFLNNPF